MYQGRVAPFIDEWDEHKNYPESLYSEMAQRGYLAGLMGSDLGQGNFLCNLLCTHGCHPSRSRSSGLLTQTSTRQKICILFQLIC
jgi:hypothetical protein